MVGNENDATLALAGSLEFLGEGCTRRVYIDDAHTVVYKVEHFDQEVAHTSNYDEVETAARATVLPDNVRIPAMTLYPNGVLAMEYIDGNPLGECFCTADEECYDDCLSSDMVDKLSKVSPDCISWGNVILREGIYYLVDLGH